jgi:hypothetical protein
VEDARGNLYLIPVRGFLDKPGIDLCHYFRVTVIVIGKFLKFIINRRERDIAADLEMQPGISYQVQNIFHTCADGILSQ